MSTPLQSPISKIRREIIDQLDALENLATSKAKALETAEQRYLEIERERDGLNRDQTELAARVDELKAQLANQATVPRVISADELKAGQKLAIESVDGHGDVFTVQSVGTSWEGYPAAYKTGGSFWAITEDERIWLLEDAPAQEPVKMGDTVATAEEWYALPSWTVVRTTPGDIAQKRSGGDFKVIGVEEMFRISVTELPATVVYLPEGDS